jgi:hypothetical protein
MVWRVHGADGARLRQHRAGGWPRAIAVIVAILVGQLIAIAVVTFSCRNVAVRDHDSYLALARLLKRAMGIAEGRSVDGGKEHTVYLEGKGASLKYETRQMGDGTYEVDLCHVVDKTFPDATYR